ncbi:MAG: hypothetical protein A3C85_03800 [Candidatus Doudnabacteria bacterium RIFCSPHIGHO2_02_FULL_48_21]|uniref:HTH deoR-type domain-containing protein n=1 Tax=Candidatus Doudnabacteria bacterium RIFCSPLOWO2_02_FULL_48_13 TaxID=1817845 RepID=A0A1F5QC05_9BACT|nr:MAG: hypothetical protein A3K05_03295 [Candidatus Doudnabacteria bacterium RIFCSPHIGHO2_01_48_18]OGE77161.1 MAG: hypothetical protein A2668_01615 [Candidatus Doudnabacteria bacterium RIFCSPHIGHO2_01_FULL_48_180]OGE91766.1 MAG: hypothetical protein A3F44_00140 [Candidatus Doudnabacteria bacterium RIFCSPHIGHO2_12_FULL_47_25]OGE93579.1 MAG: hypothetical protein A3C85_03800 [Candidatus Doudnabacteria bacterium RIFCSPHIGHO2_02_FULL_48_21]OGE96523.1 MAG: hypothetical protein A3A83_04320 [Candidatu
MIKLIIGIIIGAVLVWLFWKPKRRDLGNLAQQQLREKNLEKVLDLARTKGQVGNDDVEQALQISNATAERYLDELESIGKLIQIGKTGRNVTYKLKQ